MTLTPGARLSSYEILGSIGTGGMGEVYRARDTKLGRDVAIKVLREELASDPQRLRRFEQEARSASALNHPNIITIYEIGKVGSTPYIAMEFVEGKTLREVLSGAPLPTPKLVELGTQIAEGLAKAHSAGIVHRDLKPENLMVTSDGFVKILDFGLAKLRAHLPEASEAPTVTKEGVVLGTVGYMSPEQAKGEPADYRSDQFSFGTILYEMATGSRAFQRDTYGETIATIIRDEPQPIDQLNPQLPVHLQKVVERCLAKEPEGRYDSTRDLAHDLKSVREDFQSKQIPVIEGTEPRKATHSLAVLPLTDLRAEPGQEYFADGMTEALITDLAKIGALKVISRTSAMRYKGTDKSLPQIARELNVEAVVEGSVLRAGDRVRITAQLIHAATDQHLWAESYERDLSDILALQSEVARAIAREIQVKLTPQEDARLAPARRVDPRAHEAYLKGCHYRNKWTKDGFAKAVEYFDQAIELDPNHAMAYAHLADSHWLSSFWGDLPPRRTYPEARKAAKKAIEIDDTLGEAHSALAFIHIHSDWDFEAAEREFKRALELAPSSSYVHIWYSLYLILKSRHDEAIAEAGKARELDPLSNLTNTLLAQNFWKVRRYDEAIEEFKKWLVIEPNDWFAHLHLGICYQEKSMIKEAIAEIEKGVELSGGVAMSLVNALMIHFRFGSKEVAEQIFDRLKERARHEYVPPVCFIYIHLVRGEMDQAFEWARKACEERDGFLVWFRTAPFDSLHLPSEPRIDELLDRLGLP